MAASQVYFADTLRATAESLPETYDSTTAVDVDGIARPVVALAATVVGRAWERAQHHHRKAQLVYPHSWPRWAIASNFAEVAQN